MYNSKYVKRYKRRKTSNGHLDKRIKKRTFSSRMPETQLRLYDLFFKYPSGLDEFAYKVYNGLLPERSINQMSYNKVIYNLSRLAKTRPEIVVYSILIENKRASILELMDRSGFDYNTFEKGIKKLHKMGLVE